MNTNDDAAARIVAMAMDPDKDGEKYLFSLVRREREFALGLSTPVSYTHLTLPTIPLV